MPDRLLVGRIQKPHGLLGEVVFDLLSSEAEVRLCVGAVLQSDRGSLTVASARPHQSKWLVSFQGIATREGAETWRGVEVFGQPLVDPDALWIHDLLGAPVREANGTERGTIAGVLPNPAHDILELSGGALVPVNFVVGFAGEGEDRRLIIDPPEGLFELYDQ